MYFYTPLSLTDKLVTEGYKPRSVQEKKMPYIIIIFLNVNFGVFFSVQGVSKRALQI
jgi:hypothetical protein